MRNDTGIVSLVERAIRDGNIEYSDASYKIRITYDEMECAIHFQRSESDVDRFPKEYGQFELNQRTAR